MDIATIIAIVVVAVLVVLLALLILAARTSLLALKQRTDEAWNDIVAQLHRRADLVPGVVAVVQPYASHERGVFDAIAKARSESVEATTPAEATAAENHMQQALRGVLAVADNYPKLAAGTDFLQLQADLADAEGTIQASRRFYNGGVREFNTKLQVFPNRMIARRLGLTPRDFFEVSDTSAVAPPPRVQF